ncbi:hypothetical protein [Sorangium sp. So ce426]
MIEVIEVIEMIEVAEWPAAPPSGGAGPPVRGVAAARSYRDI